MVKTKHSFNHLILASMIFISILSVGIIGYLWLSYVYRNFKKEINSIRNTNYLEKKEHLQHDVERAISIIDTEKNIALQRLKNKLRENVNNAYAIAQAIYVNNQSKHSTEEIKAMVVGMLSTLKFNNGNEYIFAGSTSGTLDLHPFKNSITESHLLQENKPLFDSVIRQLAAIATSPDGEGWCYYKMLKPNPTGNIQDKLSYVRYFQPFNWYIGTGEYLDIHNKQVKKHILDQIKKFKPETGTYIFIGNYSGTLLLNAHSELSPLQTRQAIFPKLIESAKSGGGFIRYKLPRSPAIQGLPDTENQKLSYVAPIPDWEWFIGSGIKIKNIETLINAKREELHLLIRADILKIIAILAGLLVFIVILSKIISGKIENNLFRFSTFFHNAAEKSIQINLADLPFMEFTNMAISANKMLAAKEAVLKELADKEISLRITLNAITDAVISTNTAGLIQQMNPIAEKLSGTPSTSARNLHISQVLNLKGLNKNSSFVLDIKELQSKENYSIKLRLTRDDDDNASFPIQLNSAPMRSPQNEFIGLVFIIRDITEEIKTEEQRHHSQKMESVGKLASGIAHDFNNYLTAILGFTEMLRMDLQHDQRSLKYVKKINNSTQKASDLTKKLLLLSKKNKTGSVSTNVHCLILDVLSLLKPNLPTEIKLDKQLNATQFHVPADPSQLKTVFLNLLMNASESIAKGGKVSIKTSTETLETTDQLDPVIAFQPGLYLKIDICDTGLGIAYELQSQIFDPFFTTKEKSKGSGLGLTTAYGIIKSHRGGLSFSSSAMSGTVFSVFLPIPHTDKLEKS